MAIMFRTDGTEETYPAPDNGTDYSLKELQEAIGGGDIQVVYLTSGYLMIIDEEGKYKGFAVNPVATSLTRDLLAPDDQIVGDALVIAPDQLR